MDTRKNKRKRENPIKIENMEEYLKDLGVFDDLLRLERREFNDLMDDILLTNKHIMNSNGNNNITPMNNNIEA